MKKVKRTPSLIKFIAGIIVGVAGFAFAIMLLVKMPFLAKLFNSLWEVGWALLSFIIGLLGFYLAKSAGWAKKP